MNPVLRFVTVSLSITLASCTQVAPWKAVVNGELVPAPALDMGDDQTVRKILDEGVHRNQVMQHLTYITKQIGPRITTGSATERANRWCAEQYEKWGLSNVRVEKWGEYPVRFDRGPSSAKVVMRRETKADDGTVTKVEFEEIRALEFSTLAWTKGTDGPRKGPVIREPTTEEEYAAVKDKLAGAWILLKAPAPLGQRGIRGRLADHFSRRIDARAKLAAGTPASELPISQRLVADNVAGWLTTSRDERVWTGGAPDWNTRPLENIPDDVHLVIRGSDYDFINSRIVDQEPIELEVNAQHNLTAGPIPVFNTLAEIKGTEFPDEFVIISAHLDSWNGPGSEGCTDNGTGSAVTLEAARILAKVGAKPKRTIIFANWTGEEQGLLGSKAWVQANKDRWGKISACFVDDGGTNYEGGLGVPDWQVDILAAASAPTNNMFFDSITKEPLNVNIRGGGRKERGGGSSDHASFQQVGIPGFFWDETGRSEYGYGWHTQHDKLDLAIPEYLMQSATNAAIVAYRLACAPSLVPRDDPKKPIETPENSKPSGNSKSN